jgi:aminoglycoside phosphotransferase (APT) family kinase protein
MPVSGMHPDEMPTNVALVTRLLRAQFPQWAGYEVAPVPSAGTDNALYRLGDEMLVRLPRIAWAVGQVAKEHEWLPRLAPHLPLEVPVPLVMGEPGVGYPWLWSIYRWIEGQSVPIESAENPTQVATDLAGFVRALQEIDPYGGPEPEHPQSSRGVPLVRRDDEVREAIASLAGWIDTSAMLRAWESAVQAPAWEGDPVWIHGDLQSGNLLFLEGRLHAVIDFGCLAVGDPACDVMAAWLYLSKTTRDAFRRALNVDNATWDRARGWALSVGLIALPYYSETNPTLAGIASRAIHEVLSDVKVR